MKTLIDDENAFLVGVNSTELSKVEEILGYLEQVPYILPLIGDFLRDYIQGRSPDHELMKQAVNLARLLEVTQNIIDRLKQFEQEDA